MKSITKDKRLVSWCCQALNPLPAPGKDLFNGNISAWSRYTAPRPDGSGGQALAFEG